ncbi:fungal-specific transcription factor domain-containing protein [Blyttiomyces helicus]|uniref:Fungal-specific transcription factor domain-containing protein n=1 Tax=Blyttiomyces helicus TaxID=388810 RepID=A0A4P9WGC1_9FUNG|nr:fungal-specific transcription factor domain-containing protein [Blyttiomyces helicus]|eukprot:RKO90955.1 fungal-specific transcription factor domain-containing protein [Blyttiomyces helicus]
MGGSHRLHTELTPYHRASLKKMESLLSSVPGLNGGTNASGGSGRSSLRSVSPNPPVLAAGARFGGKRRQKEDRRKSSVASAGGRSGSNDSEDALFCLPLLLPPWKHGPFYSNGIITVPWRIPASSEKGVPEGVLPLPPALMFELASLYFTHIHPFFPILDRDVFFKHLAEYPDTWPFNVLLSAVLSIVTLHPPALAHLGVTSDMSVALFAQTKMLLFKVERVPDVMVVQAGLIISMFGFSRGYLVNRYRYICAAVRMAQEIGLHRNLSENIRDNSLDNESEQQRRRTWFAAYIMDRHMALTHGRPLMIHDTDWDTPPPTATDPVGYLDTLYLEHHVALLRIVGTLLARVNRARPVVQPRESTPELCTRVSRELVEWKQALPVALRDPVVGSWTRRECLHMFSYVAVILLRRIALLNENKDAGAVPIDPEMSLAARCITELASGVRQLYQSANPHGIVAGDLGIAYIFPSSITAVASAWHVHFLELKANMEPGSDGGGGAEAARENLRALHLVLEQIERVHPAQNRALDGMAEILKAHGIDIPVRVNIPPSPTKPLPVTANPPLPPSHQHPHYPTPLSTSFPDRPLLSPHPSSARHRMDADPLAPPSPPAQHHPSNSAPRQPSPHTLSHNPISSYAQYPPSLPPPPSTYPPYAGNSNGQPSLAFPQLYTFPDVTPPVTYADGPRDPADPVGGLPYAPSPSLHAFGSPLEDPLTLPDNFFVDLLLNPFSDDVPWSMTGLG